MFSSTQKQALFLAGVFDSEELHMLNRGHGNGQDALHARLPLGHPVKHQTMSLTLTVRYVYFGNSVRLEAKLHKLRKTKVFCMIEGTVEFLGSKKSEINSNAPIIPPCPASTHTGEAQYPTF